MHVSNIAPRVYLKYSSVIFLLKFLEINPRISKLHKDTLEQIGNHFRGEITEMID